MRGIDRVLCSVVTNVVNSLADLRFNDFCEHRQPEIVHPSKPPSDLANGCPKNLVLRSGFRKLDELRIVILLSQPLIRDLQSHLPALQCLVVAARQLHLSREIAFYEPVLLIYWE